MGDRIVHVQKVEIVKLRDLRHARRQGQVIGRIIEKRIPRNFNLVVMNVGVGRGQADRLGIGNEMNFVAALG